MVIYQINYIRNTRSPYGGLISGLFAGSLCSGSVCELHVAVIHWREGCVEEDAGKRGPEDVPSGLRWEAFFRLNRDFWPPPGAPAGFGRGSGSAR